MYTSCVLGLCPSALFNEFFTYKKKSKRSLFFFIHPKKKKKRGSFSVKLLLLKYVKI